MFSCEFWFLVFSAKCSSKCPCFTKLFLPWKVSGCLSALTHHSFCKTHHLKCLTIFWIHPCLDNCSVVFTVTVTPRYVQHQTNSKFWHIENSVYLGICRQIQAYSALLTHIHAYWDIIRAHSSLFIIFSTQGNSYVLTTLPYSAAGIFKTGGVFKTLRNFAQAYSESCHSPNSLLRHYSAAFRVIQNLV